MSRPFLSEALQPIDAPRSGCRAFGVAEVRGVDEAKRRVEAIISAPCIDRYDEVILPDAIMAGIDRFRRNPVLLAGHVHSADDGSSGIIGRWVDIRKQRVRGVGECVVGVCEFMTDDPLAESWWQRYRQGVAKAFSIGFIARAWEMRDYEDGANRRRVRTYTDIQLLEVSCVSVPACEDALVLAASYGARGPVPRSAMFPDAEAGDGWDAGEGDDGRLGGGLPSGGGSGVLSNRRMNKKLERSVGPMIKAEIRRALNPEAGTELALLIQAVAEVTVQEMRHLVQASPTEKSRRAGTRAPSAPSDGLDDLLGGTPDAAGQPRGSGRSGKRPGQGASAASDSSPEGDRSWWDEAEVLIGGDYDSAITDHEG